MLQLSRIGQKEPICFSIQAIQALQFRLASVSSRHVPNIFLALSCFPCPTLGICYFLKEPGAFAWKTAFKSQHLSARWCWGHCSKRLCVQRARKCVCVLDKCPNHSHIHTLTPLITALSIYPSVYLLTYLSSLPAHEFTQGITSAIQHKVEQTQDSFQFVPFHL